MLSKLLRKSFTVGLWESCLRCARDYHPHGLLFNVFKRIFKIVGDEQSYAFIDFWVHLHLLISVVFWIVVCTLHLPTWFIWTFIIYGALRLSYVVIYNANVTLFDQFRTKTKTYALRGYRRILVLLLINYAEIVLWFAIFYRLSKHCFCAPNVGLDTVWGSLYFSIVTMTTLGYGDIKPANTYGALLCGLQVILGVFWAVVVVARFITVLPKVRSNDPDEACDE